MIVLDDHSEDATAEIVSRAGRGRWAGATGPWSGVARRTGAVSNTRAGCWLTRRETPCWFSSMPTSSSRPTLWSRMVVFLRATAADLASGIPHQQTVGILEKLVIPLIHFILLGFLPIRMMRGTTQPHFAAGCGQLFITTRDAYERAGGHAAIRSTLHDGIKLPRAYRTAGLRTDLFDATDLAECRMYRMRRCALERPGQECRRGAGLAQADRADDAAAHRGPGAAHGIARDGAGVGAGALAGVGLALTAAAVAAAYYPRLAAVGRFRQSLAGALFASRRRIVIGGDSVGCTGSKLAGKPASWKGRAYPARAVLEAAQVERRIP